MNDPDRGLTLHASPGVVRDQRDPASTARATLTLVASFTATTRDPHPGADHPTRLDTLPVLSGYSVQTARDTVGITDAAGSYLYRGTLGPRVPDGWHRALARRGLLAVLRCSGIDLASVDRTERIASRTERHDPGIPDASPPAIIGCAAGRPGINQGRG